MQGNRDCVMAFRPQEVYQRETTFSPHAFYVPFLWLNSYGNSLPAPK